MNCRSAGLVNLLAFDILVQVLLEVRRYLLFPNKKIVMEFSLSLSLSLCSLRFHLGLLQPAP